MKTVFNTREVAHIWAQNKQDEGRNAGDTLSLRITNGRRTLYSYNASIAFHLTEGVVVMDGRHYSATTSRHQSYARHATNKQSIEINGATPYMNATELAELCIKLAVDALEPVATRAMRATYKVRNQAYTWGRLLGYMGVLTDSDNSRAKSIRELNGRLVDSGLVEAVDSMMWAAVDRGKEQLSKVEAEKLAKAIAAYHNYTYAADGTVRYKQVMDQARYQYKTEPVAAVLYLYRYVLGCNQQLQLRLTKAQVKRLHKLYETLRAGAVGQLDFSAENYDRDWALAEHTLDVFAPVLTDGALAHARVEVYRIKHEGLSTKLRSILDEEDGSEQSHRYAEGRVRQWRADAADMPELQAQADGWLAESQRKALEAAATLVHRWRTKQPLLSSEEHALYRLPVMLRLNPLTKYGQVVNGTFDKQEIETSHGATVPVKVARGLWSLVLDVRANGPKLIERMTVGDYTLNKVEPDGTLIIGCHTLPYDELVLMAHKLGFIEEGVAA